MLKVSTRVYRNLTIVRALSRYSINSDIKFIEPIILEAARNGNLNLTDGEDTPLNEAFIRLNSLRHLEAIKLMLDNGAKLPEDQSLAESMIYFLSGNYHQAYPIKHFQSKEIPTDKIPLLSSLRSLSLKSLDLKTRKLFDPNSSFIRRIPPNFTSLSTDEALAFAKVLSRVFYMAENLFLNLGYLLKDRESGELRISQEVYTYIDNFSADFFINSLTRTNGCWQDTLKKLVIFHFREISNLMDAARHFAEKILLPEFGRITKYRTQTGNIDIDLTCKILAVYALEFLMGERSLHVMLDLQRDWHVISHEIASNTRDSRNSISSWLTLCEDVEEEGLRISFIDNDTKLYAYSKQMGNCAATYSNRCLTEHTHIGIVTKDDKIISMFEINFRHNHFKENFVLVQHENFKNTPVKKESPEDIAVKKFIENLNRRTIRTDIQALDKQYENNSKLLKGNISRVCGFDIYAPSSAEFEKKALDYFLKIRTGRREESVVKHPKYFIPQHNEYKDLTVAEFLEITGLIEKVRYLASQPPVIEPESLALGARR